MQLKSVFNKLEYNLLVIVFDNEVSMFSNFINCVTCKANSFYLYNIKENNLIPSISTSHITEDIEETKEIESGTISNTYEYCNKKTGNKYAVTISNFPIKYFNKEKIKQETRRYAKRQITWFKRTQNIKWLDGLSSTQNNIRIIFWTLKAKAMQKLSAGCATHRKLQRIS